MACDKCSIMLSYKRRFFLSLYMKKSSAFLFVVLLLPLRALAQCAKNIGFMCAPARDVKGIVTSELHIILSLLVIISGALILWGWRGVLNSMGEKRKILRAEIFFWAGFIGLVMVAMAWLVIGDIAEYYFYYGLWPVSWENNGYEIVAREVYTNAPTPPFAKGGVFWIHDSDPPSPCRRPKARDFDEARRVDWASCWDYGKIEMELITRKLC